MVEGNDRYRYDRRPSDRFSRTFDSIALSNQTTMNHDRYDDPFVRILELWVLATLGAIDEEERAAMKQLEPELRQMYGFDQLGWRKIVERVMEFGEGADEEVRDLWKERKQAAQETGETITPRQFAAETADRLWPEEGMEEG